MRERKKLLPRRKKALRRLGLLALALAVMLTLGDYGFTPWTALRTSETYYQMGQTQMVNDFGDLGLSRVGPARGWLTESGQGLLFSTAHFHWRAGWQPAGGLRVEPEEGCPLSCGVVNLFAYGESANGSWGNLDRRHIIFGRITDPAIVRVRLELRGTRQVDSIPQAIRDGYALEWEEWGRWEGDTLFLQELPAELYHVDRGELIGYDAKGNEAARCKIAAGWITIAQGQYGGRP